MDDLDRESARDAIRAARRETHYRLGTPQTGGVSGRSVGSDHEVDGSGGVLVRRLVKEDTVHGNVAVVGVPPRVEVDFVDDVRNVAAGIARAHVANGAHVGKRVEACYGSDIVVVGNVPGAGAAAGVHDDGKVQVGMERQPWGCEQRISASRDDIGEQSCTDALYRGDHVDELVG